MEVHQSLSHAIWADNFFIFAQGDRQEGKKMISTMMQELTISIREWGFEWKPSSIELATFGVDFEAE
eukprot:7203253-Pyramimonas_sp.AAC.1